MDATLTQRLPRVEFRHCTMPGAAPTLARLLRSDALTTLVFDGTFMLEDAAAARELAAALRANTTLTSLTLHNANLFDDAATGVALLAGLAGHASVAVLSVVQMRGLGEVVLAPEVRATAGAAFGTLLAANARALTDLHVSCDLGDEGLHPLLHALPRNTHLRTLFVGYNRMDFSDALARDVLLPAVRANSSLRSLACDICILDYTEQEDPSIRELQALLAQRPPAG
jgi:hypothetical protein